MFKYTLSLTYDKILNLNYLIHEKNVHRTVFYEHYKKNIRMQ